MRVTITGEVIILETVRKWWPMMRNGRGQLAISRREGSGAAATLRRQMKMIGKV
jgi:hypothetical protein